MIHGFTTSQRRSIVRQYFEGGLSIEQISDTWGVAPTAIQAVLDHRAKLDDTKGIVRLAKTD